MYGRHLYDLSCVSLEGATIRQPSAPTPSRSSPVADRSRPNQKFFPAILEDCIPTSSFTVQGGVESMNYCILAWS